MDHEEFHKYLEDIGFYSPSREICVEWIHSNEGAKKKDLEESLAAHPEQTVEISQQEWEEFRDMVSTECFNKDYVALSEDEKKTVDDNLAGP